ncbi:MAG TPA: hypothetical protein PLV68_07325, partial [Ilumatobacteraceae bacterium]|nr:hypothetical protein [Ilumatobacteraceae bacterium]
MRTDASWGQEGLWKLGAGAERPSRAVAATVPVTRGEDEMKLDFTGKKAIVCGGSRGIGKAIAMGFAACGGDV